MTFIRARAPLRLGFGGGGTDVQQYSENFGGVVLNATISLYTHAFVESAEDHVTFEAIELEQVLVFKDLLQIPHDSSLLLHTSVYKRMMVDFNDGINLPLSISTYSDAPPGSGLGTSSTLVVTMIKALSDYMNLPLSNYDIAKLAFEIERNDCGLAGGAQDQYTATFGGVNYMEFLQTGQVIVNPLRINSSILCELDSSLLLFFTGQSRSSAAIISEQIDKVKDNTPISLDALHSIKDNANEMKKSLLLGNILKFAQLLNEGWNFKKTLTNKISNSRIDKAYDLAMESGAWGAKISGAGGGGFLMILCNPLRRPHIQKALEALPFGRVSKCHIVDEGVTSWRQI